MNIAIFTDAPFDDQDAFRDFQLSHGIAHDQIAKTMFAQGLQYGTYPLYETPREDKSWLLDHQTEHESIYYLLGLTGMPDLATVSFDKQDEYEDWMLLHQQVHSLINDTLGIN